MQKEFENKYNFRLLEMAMLNAKVDNLEQKLTLAKQNMQNMETLFATYC